MIDLDCGNWSECNTIFHNRNVKRQCPTTLGLWVNIFFWKGWTRNYPNYPMQSAQIWSPVHVLQAQPNLNPAVQLCGDSDQAYLDEATSVVSRCKPPAMDQQMKTCWRSWSFSNVGVKWGFITPFQFLSLGNDSEHKQVTENDLKQARTQNQFLSHRKTDRGHTELKSGKNRWWKKNTDKSITNSFSLLNLKGWCAFISFTIVSF